MRKTIGIFILLILVSFPFDLMSIKLTKIYYFEKIKTNWDYLIEALINVESNGNDTIVNKYNYGGCLQIGKSYLKDVNRISSYQKGKIYYLNDRLNRAKSLEMFGIMQEYYNPKKNIPKAIRLHNPTAGKNYLNKVLKEYNKIKPKCDMGGRIDLYVPP